MWVSAFFGMATIYGEAVLAQVYKEEKDGDITGGPVYYIKAAFSGTLGKVLVRTLCGIHHLGFRLYGKYGAVQLYRCSVPGSLPYYEL